MSVDATQSGGNVTADILPLLTADEVAALLRVHVKTVHRWADDGKLPEVRTPTGGRRYHRADVDALLTVAREAPVVQLPGQQKLDFSDEA